MKTRRLSTMLAIAWALAPVPALAQALESLKCVPDLPYARITQEFSALLEKPECADVQIRSNIETHLLFVRDCRLQPSDWTASQCKTFNFQINNATTDTPRARGALFFMKGSAKWCKPSPASHTWTAAEPEKITESKVIKGGPQTLPDACPDQPPYQLSSIQPPPTTAPTPTVAAPSMPAPPPPLPKCARDYRLVCADLAALRYLPSATATDAEFETAVRSFLVDEREPTATPVPPPPTELGRLSAAAVARPSVARGCSGDRSAKGTVVACGKVL